MQNKAVLLYAGIMLVVGVIAFYIVSGRQDERVLPGDALHIQKVIQTTERERKELALAPKLQKLSYNWQLMTKLADLAHVRYEYRGTKEADVRHVYTGGASMWDGVMTGATIPMIALVSTLQKEVPVFLNLVEAKEGNLTFHFSIVGEEP